MIKKKGVSPVIATVLLVGIVVALGVIIFLWFNSLKGEAITKFEGQNVELLCQSVSLDAKYDSSTGLYVKNDGEVPVFGLSVKTISSDGDYLTESIRDLSQNWPSTGLNPGGIYSSSLNIGGDIRSIMVIPILRGETKKGQKNYECPESTGYSLI